MRIAMVATLLLSPLMVSMVNAQAKLANPAKASMLSAAAAEDRATPKATAMRVSTGTVEPQLVKTVNVQQDTVSAIGGEGRKAVVSMIVDETGKPSNVKIVESAGNPLLDQNVVSAVEKFRWKPGTVSGQTVAFPVQLHITIEQKGL